MIDGHFAGDMLGGVPEEKQTRAVSRYETFIATFIALLAVSVAGYTAYMQRQQVRAAVWPILEFDTSNARYPLYRFQQGRRTGHHTACDREDRWSAGAKLE